MQQLRYTLRVDLRRSILSPCFLLAIVLTLLWLFLNIAEYMVKPSTPDIFYPAELVNAATVYETRSFANLIMVIAATSYSWSYCQDVNSGFLEQIKSRTGIESYAVSRVVTVAGSAFLSTVAALGIFTVFLFMWLHPEENNIITVGLSYMTVAKENPALYFVIRYLITGLTASLSAVFGLMVTGYITNAYMTFMLPLMTYYFLRLVDRFLRFMPRWFNIFHMMFGEPVDEDIPAFFIAATELLLLTALCGWVFCRKLRKEQSA